jgi:hypothetical protein
VASDRAAAAGRQREDLERAADAATAALDRHLTALDRRLDPNVPLGDDDGLPDGVTRVTVRGTTPLVEPAGSLPYLPDAAPSEMPGTRDLVMATRLELVDRDLGGQRMVRASVSLSRQPVWRYFEIGRPVQSSSEARHVVTSTVPFVVLITDAAVAPRNSCALDRVVTRLRRSHTPCAVPSKLPVRPAASRMPARFAVRHPGRIALRRPSTMQSP